MTFAIEINPDQTIRYVSHFAPGRGSHSHSSFQRCVSRRRSTPASRSTSIGDIRGGAQSRVTTTNSIAAKVRVWSVWFCTAASTMRIFSNQRKVEAMVKMLTTTTKKKKKSEWVENLLMLAHNIPL